MNFKIKSLAIEMNLLDVISYYQKQGKLEAQLPKHTTADQSYDGWTFITRFYFM